MKKKGSKKIVIIVLIILVVLTVTQLFVLGAMGGIGPLGFIRNNRIAKHPGNSTDYDFSTIEQAENNLLTGKNICVLGSSVAYGSASQENSIGEYLAARFGANITKEAVGGTTLVDKGNSYIHRMLNNIPQDAQFDLFICQLSTNDATKKLPLGQISESMELSAFDTSTVTGAMEYIICYARQTWGCPVVFFTGAYYSSAEYDAMVTQLLKLEEKWGIGVLNLWTDEEFNSISEQERSLYMNDKIHPTKAGYRDWWCPEMERQLLQFLAQ